MRRVTEGVCVEGVPHHVWEEITVQPEHHAPVSLWRSAVQATLHCLTGCAIGEVLGMVIATALSWGNAPSIALSVVLAFVFGYALTLRPVIAAGVPLRRALGLAAFGAGAFAGDSDINTIRLLPGPRRPRRPR